ncbi:nitroreductase family protein [uncultured Jatrophihabitans sp.]|uniref:nitroreductase family protein n=1 Tax=uncultured Jatrophihabitans sp. TaxID=1610747 RepID=UPI0035CC1B36
MELADAVRSRRMTRSYDPDRQVPREQIDELLELALRAPSAGHTQGWDFLVLADITSRARFWSATSGAEPADTWLTRMRTAPVLVVCLSDRDAYLDRYAEPDKGWTDRDVARWPIPYWHVDVGMAAMILLLAAQDAGLAACFFGVPSERWPALFAEFGIPADRCAVGVVSLGHRAPDVRSPSLKRGRRPFAEVVHYETFGPADPDG